jgi:DNA invertase Pin-like site-specific DNA recombinase
MKRATIYARVSTKDQSVEGQIIDLRNYAQARGLQVIQVYIDFASGSRNDRENYLKLLDEHTYFASCFSAKFGFLILF